MYNLHKSASQVFTDSFTHQNKNIINIIINTVTMASKCSKTTDLIKTVPDVLEIGSYLPAS